MKLFKTDGFRGKYNETVTKDIFYKIGLTVKGYTIVVGTDTRFSSYGLAKALIKGLEKNNTVQYAGVIPTAGLMYYSKLNSVLGMMITASHNVFTDNGLKLFLNGEKICTNLEMQIERDLQDIKDTYIQDNTTLVVTKDIVGVYTKYLKTIIPNTNNFIIDCANGAVSDICIELFDKDQLINYKYDGYNINENCGALFPNNLLKLLSEEKPIGFAFDGDGDRLVVVKNQVGIVETEQLAFLLAINEQKNKTLTNDTLVCSNVTNPGLEQSLKKYNINVVYTEVGDKYISNCLKTNNYTLGMEPSGHIVFNNYANYSDGFISLSMFNKVLQNTDFSIINQLSLLNKSSYTLQRNKSLILPTYLKLYIDNLKEQGLYTIIRNSGTENVVRVFFYYENFDYDLISKVLNLIKELI